MVFVFDFAITSLLRASTPDPLSENINTSPKNNDKTMFGNRSPVATILDPKNPDNKPVNSHVKLSPRNLDNTKTENEKYLDRESKQKENQGPHSVVHVVIKTDIDSNEEQKSVETGQYDDHGVCKPNPTDTRSFRKISSTQTTTQKRKQHQQLKWIHAMIIAAVQHQTCNAK